MGVMGKLRVFVVQEPVVAASCLIAGFDHLCCIHQTCIYKEPRDCAPAIQVFFFQLLLCPYWIHLRLPNKFPQPTLSDVVPGAAGKK